MVSSAPMWHRTLSARRGSPPPSGVPISFSCTKSPSFSGASLDGNKGGGALAHFFERLVNFGVAHRKVFDFDFQILVVAELEFRQNFEHRAEFQRAPSVKSTLSTCGCVTGESFFSVTASRDVRGPAIAALRL